MSGFAKGRAMGLIILIILIILLFGGGLGTRYGGWGGPGYASFGYGGIGLGTILIIVLIGVRGFEPPAPASRTQCSTRLSYTPAAGRYSGAAHTEQG
jgi:hypothetical protein